MEAAVDGADPGQEETDVDSRQGIDLASIEDAHYELMATYDRVLGLASRLGEKKEDDDPLASLEGGKGLISLIQLMVRAHVRSRLIEVATAFAQVAATIRPADGSARAWLDGAREDCELIAGGLPAARFKPLVLLPLVVPLVTLLSKNAPGWVGSVFQALAGGLIFLAFTGYRVVRDSYRCKRELLLPNASEIDRMDRDRQLEFKAGNTYLVEDLALASLGRGKWAAEMEVDFVIAFVALVLLVEGLAITSFIVSNNTSQWVISVSAAVSAVAAYFILRKIELHRVWR